MLITIDREIFLSGMALSNYYDNATLSNRWNWMAYPNYNANPGYSPDSLGIETNYGGADLGLLQTGRVPVEYSNYLQNAIAASCYFTTYYYSVDYASHIYKTDNSSHIHTVQDTMSKSTGDYSDIIVYQGKLFVTSNTDIYYTDLAFATKNNTWWTVTQGKTALQTSMSDGSGRGLTHFMFEFNGILYIVDGNMIHTWDGTTATYAYLTLPNNYLITDIEIDNNMIYLAINVNNIYSKILVWDSITKTTWNSEYVVYAPNISAIVKAEQGFILFANNDLYYFDGNSYQWIRYIGATPSRNMVECLGGNIYFVNSNGIGCYNIRIKSLTQPIYYQYGSAISCLNISILGSIDFFAQPFIGNGYTNTKFYTCYGLGACNTFYSIFYDVLSANIRRIEVMFATPLNDNADYTLQILDINGTVLHTQEITKTAEGAIIKKNWRIDKKVDVFRVALSFNNSACNAIKHIKVFYDDSERFDNK